MEKNEMQRYQLRLAGGERLDDLFGKMLLRIREFLDGTPDWRARPPREESRLEGELRGVMSYYVTAYDLCGIKVSCFETADPVSWSAGPDPKLSGPLAWRDQRILQLEVKNGLDEFLSAMVAAVLRALCRDPARARQAKRMRGGLERVVKGVLGPRLFRSMDYGCDLCLVVTRVNPWNLDAVGRSPC